MNNSEFDPKCGDFDPYACWDADCHQVEEQCFGSIDDDDFEEFLYCAAPEDFICPLYKAKVEKDLKCDIM